ncbi:hypothetical protein BGZ79_002344 [Entomortierella chlamydospora]|nr:hypothetical protein BGZ79_002344 [Entomortierella chlamydospora]
MKPLQALVICALPVLLVRAQQPVQESPQFVCQINEIKNSGCTGPKSCLYPKPMDCHSYVRCEITSGSTAYPTTVSPVVFRCSGDDEWNDQKKECVGPGLGDLDCRFQQPS